MTPVGPDDVAASNGRPRDGRDPATRISARWGIAIDPITDGYTIGDIASGAAVVKLIRASGAFLRIWPLGDLFDAKAHTRIISLRARSRFKPLTGPEAVDIAQQVIELCGGNDDDPRSEAEQWISDFIGAVGDTVTAALDDDGVPDWETLNKRAIAQAALALDRADVAGKTAAMSDPSGRMWLPAGALKTHSQARISWSQFTSRLAEIDWRRIDVDRWKGTGRHRAGDPRHHVVFYVGYDATTDVEIDTEPDTTTPVPAEPAAQQESLIGIDYLALRGG